MAHGPAWSPCPTCGKPWRRWCGTKLTGHAGCHFPPDVQDEIMRKWESPKVSVKMLSAEYGVTSGVILASVHAARLRAGLPGLRR